MGHVGSPAPLGAPLPLHDPVGHRRSSHIGPFINLSERLPRLPHLETYLFRSMSLRHHALLLLCTPCAFHRSCQLTTGFTVLDRLPAVVLFLASGQGDQIGRASCRERM